MHRAFAGVVCIALGLVAGCKQPDVRKTVAVNFEAPQRGRRSRATLHYPAPPGSKPEATLRWDGNLFVVSTESKKGTETVFSYDPRIDDSSSPTTITVSTKIVVATGTERLTYENHENTRTLVLDASKPFTVVEKPSPPPAK